MEIRIGGTRWGEDGRREYQEKQLESGVGEHLRDKVET